MNVSIPAPVLAAAESMSLADRGISAAKVILTGFVVVFAVLLLLILIIKVYSTIVGKAQDASGRRAKKKLKVKEGELKLAAKTVPAKPSEKTEAPPSSDEIPEEVVAVIAAAVTAMYGSSGKARIKSIKRSGGRRSAWANAGIADNTRPFNQ